MLYVRNLKAEVTEEELKECFEPYGKIERVKKIKDYGFVHFEEREAAITALEEMNGKVLCIIHSCQLQLQCKNGVALDSKK